MALVVSVLCSDSPRITVETSLISLCTYQGPPLKWSNRQPDGAPQLCLLVYKPHEYYSYIYHKPLLSYLDPVEVRMSSGKKYKVHQECWGNVLPRTHYMIGSWNLNLCRLVVNQANHEIIDINTAKNAGKTRGWESPNQRFTSNKWRGCGGLGSPMLISAKRISIVRTCFSKQDLVGSDLNPSYCGWKKSCTSW